jgi:hypothetical protein
MIYPFHQGVTFLWRRLGLYDTLSGHLLDLQTQSYPPLPLEGIGFGLAFGPTIHYASHLRSHTTVPKEIPFDEVSSQSSHAQHI